MTKSTGAQLRLATTEDAPGIIALITEVYTEFGETMCLDNGDRDLLQIESYYFSRGGGFWVLEIDGTIVGSHAAHPLPDRPRVCTFRRLYLRSGLRGSEWGKRLMEVTMEWGRQAGFRRIEFWSDTRFQRAHRFFEKFGFQKTGAIREMNDSVVPYWEYFFVLNLEQ
jgi:N-acetylglutamate synthase-like GNAT family acetyltransferase